MIFLCPFVNTFRAGDGVFLLDFTLLVVVDVDELAPGAHVVCAPLAVLLFDGGHGWLLFSCCLLLRGDCVSE